MNRLQKLIEQMRHEIESASLHYDIDELIDAFETFEEVAIQFIENHEDEE